MRMWTQQQFSKLKKNKNKKQIQKGLGTVSADSKAPQGPSQPSTSLSNPHVKAQDGTPAQQRAEVLLAFQHWRSVAGSPCTVPVGTHHSIICLVRHS